MKIKNSIYIESKLWDKAKEIGKRMIPKLSRNQLIEYAISLADKKVKA